MDCCLTYYPYKSHRCAVPITIGLCILGFVEACFFAHQHMFLETIALLLLCTSLLLFTKFLYNTAGKVVIFNADGLKIIEKNQKNHYFFSWQSFQYAYYSRNYKGYRFLLLSPRVLDCNHIREGTQSGTRGKCIFSLDIVVIHLASKQDVSTIERIIANKNLRRTGDGSLS